MVFAMNLNTILQYRQEVAFSTILTITKYRFKTYYIKLTSANYEYVFIINLTYYGYILTPFFYQI